MGLTAEQLTALAAALSALLTGVVLKALDYAFGKESRIVQAAQARKVDAETRNVETESLQSIIDTLREQVDYQAKQIAELRARNRQLEKRVDDLTSWIGDLGRVADICARAGGGHECPLIGTIGNGNGASKPKEG